MARIIHQGSASSLSATCQHSISVGSVSFLVEQGGKLLIAAELTVKLQRLDPPVNSIRPNELTLVIRRMYLSLVTPIR